MAISSLFPTGWTDYSLIDTGDGQRLERFGDFLIVRPDPNVLWPKFQPNHKGWQNPDARYVGKEQQEGGWELKDPKLANGWKIAFQDIVLQVKPTPFRHMAVFPEQAAHWAWLQELISHATKPVSVLNLFAYTGGASIAAALKGAEVCHVDASKGSMYLAKENAALSGLSETAIRWIVDDAVKFMRREARREKKYDIILMDPPVFGRGPKGEIWRLEDGIAELAECAADLMGDKPLGFLMNFYATSRYPESFSRVFHDRMAGKGLELEVGSLNLREELSGKELPTGFFLRS